MGTSRLLLGVCECACQGEEGRGLGLAACSGGSSQGRHSLLRAVLLSSRAAAPFSLALRAEEAHNGRLSTDLCVNTFIFCQRTCQAAQSSGRTLCCSCSPAHVLSILWKLVLCCPAQGLGTCPTGSGVLRGIFGLAEGDVSVPDSQG